MRFGVGFEKLQGLSPWIWNGNARTVVAAAGVEVWGQIDFNDGMAGERVVGLWEEVERDRAGVGVGIGEVETMTHLKPVVLVLILENVGSDKGERVCEVGVVGIEVVAS